MPSPAGIVGFVNQKGGPGKTTLAMHLAGTLGRRGERVLVVDADPQATASRWAAAAASRRPFPAQTVGVGPEPGSLHATLQQHLAAYHWIVVDCPPSADSPLLHTALLVSDLALVPVIPSPPDLWAGVAIRQVLDRAMSINTGLVARLVVNQFVPRTLLAARTLALLPRYGIPVLDTRIGDRQAYRHAAAAGLTVADLPRTRQAAAEIEAFTDEVVQLVAGARAG